MTQRRVSVCVVGAGAAGLCAARHLASQPETFSFRVFEQAPGVGGTWAFTEQTGSDAHGLPVHSSMYEKLRTNIQQEAMSFPDFPFPRAESTSYPGHEVVLKYLEDYTAHFDLAKHISFRTVVRTVRPRAGGGWAVRALRLDTLREEAAAFDAVIVCNGHYATPLLPEVLGIEEYEGEVLHSHDFRRAEPFAGREVAVLGAGASGRDIALEVARQATTVYLCHRGPRLASRLPANVVQVGSVARATPTGFVLEDGASIHADALLLCTGYNYTFPFLSPECGVIVRGRRVRPLYKHIVNIEKPTLGFVGIPFIVLPFPLFHYQVAFFLKSLAEPSILPGKEEMYEDEKKDFLLRIRLGWPTKYAHKMDTLQWEYNDELADAAGIERLHPVIRELYEINGNQMKHFLTECKNKCYADLFEKKIKE